MTLYMEAFGDVQGLSLGTRTSRKKLYKLIQNQTTDRQEQARSGRTLRTGKLAGRSTIRYIMSVHAS